MKVSLLSVKKYFIKVRYQDLLAIGKSDGDLERSAPLLSVGVKLGLKFVLVADVLGGRKDLDNLEGLSLEHGSGLAVFDADL